MKRLWTLLIVFCLASTFVAAQNGNGNGPCNGNGNPPGGGQAGWGSGQNLITWLQNGGAIPQPLAIAVIIKARDWGNETFGLSLGQMIQKYNQGLLTIEFMYTSPPSLTFLVRYGGGLAIVTIENNM